MNRAVFLDRDGVINEVLTHWVKFVNKPEDFYLLDGVGEAIYKLNTNGYKVFVVTNQGGIGLGYMQEPMLEKVHQKMKSDLENFDAYVDDIAYCPHKPHEGCACRKPKPKMITDLIEKYRIQLSGSYMVGDRKPDIEAGKEAGLKTVLVGNRKEEKGREDLHFPSLLAFAKWLTVP